MKIDYINNTCDVDDDDIRGCGEITIFLKDGKPVSHVDSSDTVVEVDGISAALEPFMPDGILEFNSIEPDAEMKELLKEYLREEGYLEEE